MSGTRAPLPLLGYSDRLSARPGQTIAFKVSSISEEPFTARLFRSISADPNPAGLGIVEEDAAAYFAPLTLPSVERPFHAGSYGITADPVMAKPKQSLAVQVTVFPTLRSGETQSILTCGPLDLHLDASGAVALMLNGQMISTGKPLTLRHWYRIDARITADTVTLQHVALRQRGDAFAETHMLRSDLLPELSAPVLVAGCLTDAGVAQHFNGKIEAPSFHVDEELVAAWDFAQDIPTTRGVALAGPDLRFVNFPARAMTGAAWDGSEMDWKHKPSHYAAIHFHQDDIYDFEWDTDFTFTVPDGMPSGAYVMRLECGGNHDAIPFFVCAPRGKPRAKLCVLVSTFTYAIYGNHARPDYDQAWQSRTRDWDAYPHNPAEYPHYGLSTYNYHADGSGICHASHRRPLFNLRPGFLTFGNTPCSGLRHFQADSHLISWLHAKGIDYDLVTDRELHEDGVASIEGYKAVTTATHPEYHTQETLDALRDYRDGGGHLLYLGGNGFYWRIAVHGENESLLEIRRAEDGIRAWAAEPGEYYNAFDGTYGGLWRRNGRPPQDLVGVGFAAQGEFFGHPYRRVCSDPDYDWVFEGISGELIGDFGYSGNGAAGFELDHMDSRLGTPGNAVLLATSAMQDQPFMLAPEEQLTHLTNLSGLPEREVVRADMVVFEVPGGGSVFSTGSITFCGSLPWNNFENNVSRLLENVLARRLATDTPHSAAAPERQEQTA